MQLMTDTTDGPDALRLAATFLEDLARIVEGNPDAAVNGGHGGEFPKLPQTEPTLMSHGKVVTAADLSKVVWRDGPSGDSDTDGPLPPPAHVFGQKLDQLVPPTPAPKLSMPPLTLTAAVNLAPEYDSAGLPWDERIHQEGKGPGKRGTKANGEWKNRKRLDAKTLADVTAELQPLRRGVAPVQVPLPPRVSVGAPAAPVGAGASVRVPVPVGPVGAVGQTQGSGTGGPVPIPLPPGSGVAAPPPPAAASTVALDVPPFRQLMRLVTSSVQAQKITAQRVNEIVKAAGVADLPALSRAGNEAIALSVKDLVEAELLK